MCREIRDGSTIAADLATELSLHPLKMAEVTLEADGEKEEVAAPLVEVKDEFVQEEEDRDVEEILMDLPSSHVANGSTGPFKPLSLQEENGDFVTVISVNKTEAGVEAVVRTAGPHPGDKVEDVNVVVKVAQQQPVENLVKVAALAEDQVAPYAETEGATPHEDKKTPPPLETKMASLSDHKVASPPREILGSSPVHKEEAGAADSLTEGVERIELEALLSSSPKKRQFDELKEAAQKKEAKEEVIIIFLLPSMGL